MLVAEPRDSRAILAESGGDQQRVVGATAELHLDALLADADLGGSAHEAVEQLARPLALVPVPDATRQQAVQRARHQCELQVGVDLQRYGRGQRVHMEEVDRLSDRVLDHHAAGVAVDELGGLGVKLVGEQQRGLVVAEADDRDLADRGGVVGQGDAAVEGGRVAVFAADVAQGQALPAFSGEQVADQLLGAAPQGQKADAKSLQAGQDGVGGEAGVEHQFARQLAGAFAAGLGEAQDGLVLVLLAHGGVGKAEDVLLGVADQEGKHAALAAAALGDEVLLQEGFVAVVGDGVEVEIERAAALDSEVAGGGEPVGSPAGYQAGVDAAGVLGKRGALGDGVEAGEQGEALVKGVGHEAGGATDTPELEGEQGAAGAGGGDGGGTGQATAADVGVEVELGEEGQEQEQAAEVGAEGARGEVEGVDGSGDGPQPEEHGLAVQRGPERLQARLTLLHLSTKWGSLQITPASHVRWNVRSCDGFILREAAKDRLECVHRKGAAGDTETPRCLSGTEFLHPLILDLACKYVACTVEPEMVDKT